MATTYKATREAAGTEPVYNATGKVSVVSKFDLANTGTVGLTGSLDTVQVCDVPANSHILATRVDMPATGLEDSADVTWSLGDNTGTAGAFVASFIANSVIGQSAGGGIVTNSVVGSLGVDYTAQQMVEMVITNAIGTGAAVTTGIIYFVVEYTNQFDKV